MEAVSKICVIKDRNETCGVGQKKGKNCQVSGTRKTSSGYSTKTESSLWIDIILTASGMILYNFYELDVELVLLGMSYNVVARLQKSLSAWWTAISVLRSMGLE